MKAFNEETVGVAKGEFHNELIENEQGEDLVERDSFENRTNKEMVFKEVETDSLIDSEIRLNELKEGDLSKDSNKLNQTLIETDEIVINETDSDVSLEIETSTLGDTDEIELSNVEPPFQYHYFASLGRRFVSLIIDVSIIHALYWILMGNWISNYLLEYVMVVAIYCGYFALMTYYFKGQTLGKMIMGIRTVRLDGHYLTLQDVLIREVAVRSIHRIFGFLYLISLFSKERRQLGDWIADTCVVKDRG